MLEKTWRWFGASDAISLSQIRQIGVEGVVTALHHVPNGEIWSVVEINKVKTEIEKHGMRWSVVESLPVSEAIKFAGKNRDELIHNYKQSLRNLGACSIDTVCYNFMPVIDWIRTDLHYTLETGGEALFFDFAKFVAFDRYILNRPEAENEYPSEVVEKAHQLFLSMTEEDKQQLIDTIIIKTQKFVDGIDIKDGADPVSVFNSLLAQYKGISKEMLRENLQYFLSEVIPVADEAGVRLCIHPDDPPYPVLGLPRITGSKEDIQWILEAVPSPANGLTFCAGSLSAGSHNNLPKILTMFADRVHFVHLRSTQLLENGNFYEASHLEGSVNMVALVQILLREQIRRKNKGRTDYRLPMRVDHGHKLLYDFDETYNPGYPLIGRLKGLAEIDGLQHAVHQMIGMKTN